MDDVEFKTCRFCQEKIRAAAIKCRWCGEVLETPPVMALSTYIDVDGRVTGSTEAPPKQKELPEHYLLRHWRGELPLQKSFLVNGGAVAGITVVMLLLAQKVPVLESSLYVVLFAVCIWEAVGTWRSSAMHVENGGEQRWAVRAKIFVTIAALAVAWIAVGKIARQTLAMSTARNGPAYEIRVLPGAREVAFEGPVQPGASEALARVLQRNARIRTLHLNSRGGVAAEAFAMAQLVTGCELDTFVTKECLGAATLVFLAGKERAASEQANIGFEEIRSSGMSAAEREEIEAQALDIFREAEVKKPFANRALTATREQMWFPSIAEMQSAGVITKGSPAILITESSQQK